MCLCVCVFFFFACLPTHHGLTAVLALGGKYTRRQHAHLLTNRNFVLTCLDCLTPNHQVVDNIVWNSRSFDRISFPFFGMSLDIFLPAECDIVYEYVLAPIYRVIFLCFILSTL